WTQRRIIYVRIDRPAVLVPQLTDPADALGDFPYVIDLFPGHHLSHACVKQSGDSLETRALLSPDDVSSIPDPRPLIVGDRRLEPIGTGPELGDLIALQIGR